MINYQSYPILFLVYLRPQADLAVATADEAAGGKNCLSPVQQMSPLKMHIAGVYIQMLVACVYAYRHQHMAQPFFMQHLPREAEQHE